MVFIQDRFTHIYGKISRKRLGETPAYMKDHPILLHLPATYDDAMNKKVMGNIINKIGDFQKEEDCIDEIIIGLDQAYTKQQFENVYPMRKEISRMKIMPNHSPEMNELMGTIFKEQGYPEDTGGKGLNLWKALLYRYLTKRGSTYVVQDCDIVPSIYNIKIPLSIIAPMVHPAFMECDFSKLYYERLTKKKGKMELRGRVARLLFFPLIDALRENSTFPKLQEFTNKAAGDYLDLMSHFLYPLSGEFGMKSKIAEDLRIQADWGLEVSTLNFFFKTPYKIAQVDIGRYDHRHHELDNLERMAREISKTIFRKMYSIVGGDFIDSRRFTNIMKDYNKFAMKAVLSYMGYSESKGYRYEIDQEVQAVLTFAKEIIKGNNTFIKDKEEIRPLPAYDRVKPEYRTRFLEIIKQYNPN